MGPPKAHSALCFSPTPLFSGLLGWEVLGAKSGSFFELGCGVPPVNSCHCSSLTSASLVQSGGGARNLNSLERGSSIEVAGPSSRPLQSPRKLGTPVLGSASHSQALLCPLLLPLLPTPFLPSPALSAPLQVHAPGS